MKIATGKKQSRGSSIVWMLLTIAVISVVLYRAVESQAVNEPQQGQAQTATNAACGVSDIAVEKLHSRRAGSHTVITGRLVNNCNLAVGAQIKITAFDASGSILSVEDIWPASVGNIPAHSVFPFEWIADARGPSTFTGEVISVKTWIK